MRAPMPSVKKDEVSSYARVLGSCVLGTQIGSFHTVPFTHIRTTFPDHKFVTSYIAWSPLLWLCTGVGNSLLDSFGTQAHRLHGWNSWKMQAPMIPSKHPSPQKYLNETAITSHCLYFTVKAFKRSKNFKSRVIFAKGNYD